MEALLNFVVAHPWHFYTILAVLCSTLIVCCDRFSPYTDGSDDDKA